MKSWACNADVVGFYFLDLAASYTPPDDLVSFLEAGDPPIYIGYVVSYQKGLCPDCKTGLVPSLLMIQLP